VNAVRNELFEQGIEVSLVRLCTWLGIPRSSAYYQPRQRSPRRLDQALVAAIRRIIDRFPTFGIRRVWAYLRFRLKQVVNRKTVARIMRLKGWTMNKRPKGGRPRVRASRSATARPDERWATDLALIFCGARDGWCTFVPVLDCCTRQVLGWELAPTARAKTAERALEQALINRFGWTHGAPPGLVIRHDNGLVFGSKLYRRIAHEYHLVQEYITPYTPEQNGLVERFIRSLKEECVWQHRFTSIADARAHIAKWIEWYNAERPHQALGYKTPDERHAALAA
jgi:putative transposase